MRKENQFYVHGFDSIETAPFDAKDYSKLKFGSDYAAKKFGYELADAFFMEYGSEILEERLVIIPSPYNNIENAATIMSKHFMNRINHHLITNGGVATEWDTIHRKVSYIKDYGFLDQQTRKALIDGDEFYCNEKFWEGKTLVFIDDVNITGTHENKLKEILDNNNITNNTFFLYFAKYLNGSVGANIEAAINFAFVTSTEKFIELTHEPHHHCIVRPIKYLMSQELEHFKIVISQLPEKYISELYYGCLAEGYDKIDTYDSTFKFLSTYFMSSNFVK